MTAIVEKKTEIPAQSKAPFRILSSDRSETVHGAHPFVLRLPATGRLERRSGRGTEQRAEQKTEAIWRNALAWLEENKGLVVKVIASLDDPGPYEMEDFLQEAKLAVFQVWKNWADKVKPEDFAGYVVLTLRSAFRNHLGIRKDAPWRFLGNEGELLEKESLIVFPTLVENDNGKQSTVLNIQTALSLMTPRQQRAWTIFLGLKGIEGQKSCKEVAATMKISPRAAYRLLERGKRRAKRIAKNRGIKMARNQRQPSLRNNMEEEQ